MFETRTSKFASSLIVTALIGGAALLSTTAVHAQTTLTLVSNTSTFRQSTVTETDNSNDQPWAGVNLAALPGGALPALSTYTIVPTSDSGNNVATLGGTGNDSLVAGANVNFFRTTFTLPTFTNLSMSFQGTVDNDIDVFVNGHELAEEGYLSPDSFGTPYGVSLASTGVVTNAGPSGSAAFARVAGSFPQSFFTTGTNDIVIAVRNLGGGDSGGFSMLSTVKYTAASAAAPEPGSIALLATGLVPIAGLIARRRVRKPSH